MMFLIIFTLLHDLILSCAVMAVVYILLASCWRTKAVANCERLHADDAANKFLAESDQDEYRNFEEEEEEENSSANEHFEDKVDISKKTYDWSD